mmetsp:Transcript_40971/g.78245  ORF Transcript_40971/g.78245 Transcript_40971/m.78245 type:complete len:522 (+) Transcript_40971:213-1778(+)
MITSSMCEQNSRLGAVNPLPATVDNHGVYEPQRAEVDFVQSESSDTHPPRNYDRDSVWMCSDIDAEIHSMDELNGFVSKRTAEDELRVSVPPSNTTNDASSVDFGEWYMETVNASPQDYCGRWLDYARLLQVLQLCTAPTAGSAEHAQFFKELQDEYDMATHTFHEKRDIIATWRSRGTPPWKQDQQSQGGNSWCRQMGVSQVARSVGEFLISKILLEEWDDRMLWRTRMRGDPSLIQGEALVREAFWCRKYTQMTVAAIVHLLTLFDELVGGDEAARFQRKLLEESRTADGLFNSPWVIELRVLEAPARFANRRSCVSCEVDPGAEAYLESLATTQLPVRNDNLMQEAGKVEADARGDDHHSENAASMRKLSPSFSDLPCTPGRDSATHAPLRFENEEDVVCPICWEILYKPVGLSCGHVFCKLCLLRSANIVHKFNMEFKKMNNHFKCPCCRQDGELKLAVELVSLNDMIRRRFTSGWMEQECSANAELQKLRKIRHYSYKLIQRRIISAAPHAFIHSQ